MHNQSSARGKFRSADPIAPRPDAELRIRRPHSRCPLASLVLYPSPHTHNREIWHYLPTPSPLRPRPGPPRAAIAAAAAAARRHGAATRRRMGCPARPTRAPARATAQAGLAQRRRAPLWLARSIPSSMPRSRRARDGVLPTPPLRLSSPSPSPSPPPAALPSRCRSCTATSQVQSSVAPRIAGQWRMRSGRKRWRWLWRRFIPCCLLPAACCCSAVSRRSDSRRADDDDDDDDDDHARRSFPDEKGHCCLRLGAREGSYQAL
jgi:hypothetical protein